jgi:alpha/beta hydrolase family protein
VDHGGGPASRRSCQVRLGLADSDILIMQVLLIHGMGRTVLSMLRLGRELRSAGHTVHQVGYVAALESYSRILGRVRGRLARAAARGPYAVVGHSLGGLLARAALREGALFPAPAHLIMLGTPNQPPRQARRYGWLPPYRWINGECGQLLMQGEFFAGLPPLSVPYTIVAGTRSGPDRRAFGHEPNDGVVAVSETLLSAADRPIIVPARHTFMMNHGEVRAVILRILKGLEQ